VALYLEYFGLSEPPFRITPHTDFFFDGADRGATLEGLIYAVLHDEGIVKVSGEVGSGKTMLCRVLMERLPKHVATISRRRHSGATRSCSQSPTTLSSSSHRSDARSRCGSCRSTSSRSTPPDGAWWS
jgi:hypothetical protein